MVELLVGTTNPGKLDEIQGYLNGLPLKVLALPTLGTWPAVVEDGATYEDNALKKARTLAEYSGHLTLADDSGLEVDALNRAPGIYSARYCGEEGNDEKNNEKLLRELKNVPEEKRTARFVCVLALCAPKSHGAKEWTVRESCEGRIAFSPKGQNGFGYDPIFFYPSLGKTFGEIDRETKATVSHRGKALKKLAQILPLVIDLGTKP
ncbi:MAG TPA: XTP/dITP diphosphatase [Candidatus Binatia bacterium]|nr:XTP/dITP diphosphatase [Candidatus Binatia bacterium]